MHFDIGKANPRESVIAQMIIRHGEKIICYTEDENGHELPLSVAEYISLSLKDDEIKFQTPIYQRILEEAASKAHAQNFQAEQYFISHPDGEIRELALKLGTDTVELSKLFDAPSEQEVSPLGDLEGAEGAERSDGTGSLRLDEIIPSLIASYKLSIVQNKLKDIIEQMKRQEVKEDKGKYRQLMTEFNEKSKLVKELAKECGDRVVLK